MTLFEISKFVVLIPIAFFSLIGAFVLFKHKNDKKNGFLIFIAAVLLELLGYLLMVMCDNTCGAFASLRVFYLGMGILAPAVLFFAADYCDFKIHAAIKPLLCLPALAYVIGAWTTDVTGLLFASLYFDSSRYLVYEPGALFQLFQALPALYLAGALAMGTILLLDKRSVPRRFGSLLIVIFVSSVFLIDFGSRVFVFTGSTVQFFISPPFTYAFASAVMLFGVIKLKMFDSAPLSAIEAMNTINEAVIMLDERLCFVFANNAAYSLLPWLSRFIPGDSVHASPDWPNELSVDAFNGVMFNSSFTLTDGEPRHYRAKVHCFASDSSQKHWSVLIQDVTESEVFMKQLEEAAYTDTLTGLYNRRHFTEIAAPFIERAKRMNLPYYVMIADLDFFKDINDTYGHLAGDAVLRNIASIMKSAVRSYDILARWGGEEFIFLITDSDAPIVLALSERIRQNVEKAECIYQGNRLQITISFGIAQNRSDNDADITELILRADEALYRSKQNGRNRVTFWSE